MSESESFWVVIPHYVLSDPHITAGDKILYGELSSLTRKDGRCYATNSHFIEVLAMSERSVRNGLNRLQDAGYIQVETKHSKNGKKGTWRTIRLGNIDINKGDGHIGEGGEAKKGRGGRQKLPPKREIHKRDTQTVYKYTGDKSQKSEISHKEKDKGSTGEYGNPDVNRFIKGMNKYLVVKLPEDGKARKVANNSLNIFTKRNSKGDVKNGREFMDDNTWTNIKMFLAEYHDKKISKGYSPQSWGTLYQNIKLWVANEGKLPSK